METQQQMMELKQVWEIDQEELRFVRRIDQVCGPTHAISV